MVKVIGEIGINHNGCMDTCKKLILIAKASGMDYVKIQNEILMYVFQIIKKINKKILLGVK